jgi:putative ABC transport system ATP-binding protein
VSPAAEAAWAAARVAAAVRAAAPAAEAAKAAAVAKAAVAAECADEQEENHMAEALIELKDIYKIYQMGTEEVRANDGISLTIYRGEFVAIVGKSGSGKSTLMNIIGALDVPTSGSYLLGGEDVDMMSDDQLAGIRNRMIGFIFQQYNLLPKSTLLENVELPLLYAKVPKEERRERAMKSLERVGLADKWKNYPKQLSGGQQQRVSIARALAGDPSLILADEPTGALDSRTSRDVLNFLKELNEEGNTIVMITHDSSIALEAKRVVRIHDGKINFDGDVKEYAAIL